MLTRESILNLRRRTQVISVPEWGGDVTIGELTVRQQAAIAASLKNSPDREAGAVAKTILEGLIDPVLTAGDYEALLELGMAGPQRVATAIMELSGMTTTAEAAIRGK